MVRGIPVPIADDEFSYLLAADTFAHGRMTNPAHPLWEFFEAPHIILQPTYASKYPPAQGLVLALGKFVFGHPIVGVWLSLTLACAAICWMLQAWLPPHWAFGGGLLAAFQLSLFGKADFDGPPGYWSQSYWGGAVAACGGALVFGALRRLLHQPQAHVTLLFGCGLVILANSRPLEGLVISQPALILLVYWLCSRDGPPMWLAFSQVVLPLALVLALSAAAMALYNLRVTGNPLKMPYQVHEETYGAAPLLLWQSPQRALGLPSNFHNESDLRWYQQQLSLKGWLLTALLKTKNLVEFFVFSPLLIVPWLVLGWTLRNRWMRLALLTICLLALVLAQETWVFPHYAAPVTALVFALMIQGMRHIYTWRLHGWRVGPYLIGAVPVLCMATLALPSSSLRATDSISSYVDRARIGEALRREGDSHLVIIRFGSETSYEGWVYNEADIDNATVVWAREMDEDHNRRLLAYFKDRHIWLLNFNGERASLAPYEAATDFGRPHSVLR
jgi:hypothetical protein